MSENHPYPGAQGTPPGNRERLGEALDRVEEKVEQGIRQTQEQAQDVRDQVGDGLKQAGRRMEDARDRLESEIKDAGKQTGRRIEDAREQVDRGVRNARERLEQAWKDSELYERACEARSELETRFEQLQKRLEEFAIYRQAQDASRRVQEQINEANAEFTGRVGRFSRSGLEKLSDALEGMARQLRQLADQLQKQG